MENSDLQNEVAAATNHLIKLNALDELRLEDPEFSRHKAEEAPDANLYLNVIPYDHALLPGAYQNASLIPPYSGNRNSASCVASQAPLATTLSQFFEQLHAQKSKVIVNLTALEENGIVKSERYWPLDKETPFISPDGQWTVFLMSDLPAKDAFDKTQYAEAASLLDLRVRRLKLLSMMGKERKEHEITQLHFIGWPDHGALAPLHLLALIQAVRAVQPSAVPTPIWVHCSAGIGRSGTLIGTLFAQEEPILSSTNQSSIETTANITAHMRKFRPGSVQSVGQFLAMAHAIGSLRSEKGV